jgi:hypothetical protein
LDLEDSDITVGLVKAFEMIEPVGNNNSRPLVRMVQKSLTVAPCKNNSNHISITTKSGFQMFAFSYAKQSYQLLSDGEKELVFGLGCNEFGKFPEEGYSDTVTTEYVPGHYYDCACSADWIEEKKLRIYVQIIDKYFGNACLIFSFKDAGVTVLMTKNAENFLTEYDGFAIGSVKE